MVALYFKRWAIPRYVLHLPGYQRFNRKIINTKVNTIWTREWYRIYFLYHSLVLFTFSLLGSFNSNSLHIFYASFIFSSSIHLYCNTHTLYKNYKLIKGKQQPTYRRVFNHLEYFLSLLNNLTFPIYYSTKFN